MRKSLLIAAGAVLCLGLAALGLAASARVPSRTIEIKIANFTFQPAAVTIAPGTKVIWVNQDDIPHTVVSSDGKAIRSSALDTGDRYEFTFSQPGNYSYYCSVHPRMVGKVIVKK